MKRAIFVLVCLLGVSPAFAADKPSFSRWLDDFRSDAASQGISKATLDDAFSDTQPIERVIELDQKQPENRITLDEYLDNIVTDKRIDDGREFYAENRALLKKIGKEYGVQPRFIVALWGLETNYGRMTGGFSTIDSLATLAYDGRRSEFFRGELIDALKILQAEQMAASDMKGSWAGALGQCQFMPSTYLKYAVDYDGDGKRDIWHTKADVFASIANYLESLGWNADEGWGREVRLPKDFDTSLIDIKSEKTLAQWRKLGVKKLDGTPLAADHGTAASLITIGEGDDVAYYLVYGNFKSLLQWNRSRFFATSVGVLADQIGKR